MSRIGEMKFFEMLGKKSSSEAVDSKNSGEDSANNTPLPKLSLEDIKKDLQDFKKFLITNIGGDEKHGFSLQLPSFKSPYFIYLIYSLQLYFLQN
jgi:hypothetical protein